MSSRIWLMVNEHRRTYITYDPSIMTLPGHLHWPSLSRMSKSSLWNRSTDIVAIDRIEARWNLRSGGQDSVSHAIVGNHIKLYCVSTSSTIICEPMQWRPWFQVNISRLYGESFSRFSSEFFPKSARRRVFPRLVFSGWNPTYLRTLLPHPYYSLHTTLAIQHAYKVYSRMVDHPPKGGGIVTQQYVLVLSVSVNHYKSSLATPGIWYNKKSNPCRNSFHLNTLPLGVLLMYINFLWSVFNMNRRLSRYSSYILTAQYKP
jgi:hypothetical protein